MNKKILFITPPYHCGVVEVAGRWVPLTFVYLADAVRRAGFEPVIYDAMTKRHGFPEIEERIREEAPGVSAVVRLVEAAVLDVVDLGLKAQQPHALVGRFGTKVKAAIPLVATKDDLCRKILVRRFAAEAAVPGFVGGTRAADRAVDHVPLAARERRPAVQRLPVEKRLPNARSQVLDADVPPANLERVLASAHPVHL